MADTTDTTRTMKRRGLIAGAAALVVGMAAKRAMQPVAADGTVGTNFIASGVGTDRSGDFIADGTNVYGFLTGGSFTTGVSGTGGSQGVYGFSGSGDGVKGESTGGTGVTGTSTSSYGVYATSGSGTVAAIYGVSNGNFYGVHGTSGGSKAAVYGVNTSGNDAIGVQGHTGTVGVGVKGSNTNGIGVMGTISNGYGVQGIAGAGRGVVATSTSGYGVYSTTGGTYAAVYGENLSGTIGVQGYTGTYGYGVYGTVGGGVGVGGVADGGTGVGGTSSSGYGMYGASVSGIGTRGDTSASGSFGVLGVTFAPNSIALGGIANADGSSCFSGGTSNPNAFAAFFQGHVQVTSGAFDVFPMGNKHGLAPHPDGTHRTFYSVESPECWVEDFGEGTITAGKAAVKLDGDFAALVHTDHYHVFLTSHGDYHVHAAAREPDGFTVQVTGGAGKAASGAAGVSGTFSWRVVAKPKTTAKVERLAKATVGKFPLPDITKLPKAPEPPKRPTKP